MRAIGSYTLFIFFAAFLLVSSLAGAEHRAFRLVIRNDISGTERRVNSTLDHIQYPMYHSVAKNETVSIEQTWMCYKRNDYKQSLCQNPAEGPAPAVPTAPSKEP